MDHFLEKQGWEVNEIGSKGRIQVRPPGNFSLHSFDGEVIALPLGTSLLCLQGQSVGRGDAVSGHEHLSILSENALSGLPAVWQNALKQLFHPD